MRYPTILARLLPWLLVQLTVGTLAFNIRLGQQPLRDTLQKPKSVSVRLFAELERLARLVDISYCIGTTGVSKPFNCASRCSEFPTLSLAATWNTGILLSDSCGYLAVDHGNQRPDVNDEIPPGELGYKAIIIAFRGTYSITNTVVDLSTVPQKYLPYPSPDNGGDDATEPGHKCDNCTVHQGFLESWQEARKLVLPELEQLRAKYPDYPIHLVGHSLGGAVACLASLELKVSLGYENVVVTTFGEPRVGNYELTRYIDEVFSLDEDVDAEQSTFRRVTHKDDPVPLLPLTEWGYRPHGGEIYISKHDLPPAEGDVLACRGTSDPGCSAEEDSTLTEAMRRLLPWAEVDDVREEEAGLQEEHAKGFPTRYKLWQLFFSHRDYFWRLGLCVPGGDPANWGRERYDLVNGDEL
ncbi:lipase (class 3) domain-containing protein [Sarocladium implicatum]|nr:lipase (class 3) domain-containing protein [Sarocladium implicatum]